MQVSIIMRTCFSNLLFFKTSTDPSLNDSTSVASAIRLRVTVPLLGRYDITYRMTSVGLLVYVLGVYFEHFGAFANKALLAVLNPT